nr:glycosyl transferase [Paracoccus sp. (in: a-proteobacteria)]
MARTTFLRQLPTRPVPTAPDSPDPAPLPEPDTATAATLVAARDLRPLGRILLEDGAVDPNDLLKALVMRQRQSVRLGEILLAKGWVQPEALARALSRQWRTSIIDLTRLPPDPRLVDTLGPDLCLSEGIVPWRRVGGVTFVATARPEDFDALRPRLSDCFGPVRMLLCTENAAREAILAQRRTALIRQAEMRVAPQESCRTRNERRTGRIAVALMAGLVLGMILAPTAVIAVLTAWAVLALVASSTLKLISFQAILRQHRRKTRHNLEMARGRVARPEMTAPLPVISVMVPLFAEADIADRLIGRLACLDYPRELMDILLV